MHYVGFRPIQIISHFIKICVINIAKYVWNINMHLKMFISWIKKLCKLIIFEKYSSFTLKLSYKHDSNSMCGTNSYVTHFQNFCFNNSISLKIIKYGTLFYIKKKMKQRLTLSSREQFSTM